MTQRMDRQKLAALIEGRLTPTERQRVIAQLSESEEDRELYADVLETLRDLESISGVITPSRAKATITPRTPPRVVQVVRKWDDWRRIAIAAGLVLMLGGLAIWTTFAPEPAPPTRYAALLTPGAELPPAEWQERPWGTTRAPGADPITPEQRATRLGARMVDLQLSAEQRGIATASIADEVAALVEEYPGAGPVASHYRSISLASAISEDRDLRDQVVEGSRGVADIVDADYFRAGSWIQAARIAALRHDAEFFRKRSGRSALNRLERISRDDPETLAKVRAVRAAIGSGATMDWPLLERELMELLQMLAG